MLLTRLFDEKAVNLQRSGQLGTYASSMGQEAISVGVALVMEEKDLLVPSFREHGAQLLRGVSIQELLRYWGGDERGSDFQASAARADFPVSVTVGGHAIHAAGVAMAFKLRKQPRVAVCCFGDGACSKGDVYEAINYAKLWELPVVFVVSNNQWAISTPAAKQSKSETLAQKALAVGIDGVQVDGNDVVAVRSVLADLIARSREGEGPQFVECLTYRLADHTTADDASRYRDVSEVKAQWQNEPLSRLRSYINKTNVLEQNWEQEIQESCNQQIEREVENFLKDTPQKPDAFFDYMYAEIPSELQRQKQSFNARLEDKQ